MRRTRLGAEGRRVPHDRWQIHGVPLPLVTVSVAVTDLPAYRRSTELFHQSLTQRLAFDEDVADFRRVGARRLALQLRQVVV